MRSAGLNVALAVVAAALTVAAADGLMRFLSVGMPRRGFLAPKPRARLLTGRLEVFDPGYRGILTSREFRVSVRANSLGLRGPEIEFDRLAPRSPVLLIGDSYFFGWGVEESARVSEVLARLLSSGPTPRPVVNISFPGWGMYHARDVLQAFGPRLRPSLVVLGLCIANDFLDDLNYKAHGLDGGTAVLEPSHSLGGESWPS